MQALTTGGTTVFLDDIVIYARSMQEHDDKIRRRSKESENTT
jgi:hypothetical protein